MRVSRVKLFQPVVYATSLVPMALAVGVAFITLLIGRGLTFHQDEWTFLIHRRDVTTQALFAPWNEHLTAIPALLYAFLAHTFGVRSYIPFLTPVVALHIGLVAGSYLLLRRPLGGTLASAVAIVLAVSGAGNENLLWAFQVTFLASLAGSVVAVAGVRARSTWPARVATVGGACLAIASSSVGLFAIGAILLWAIVNRRRAAVVDLTVPLLAWVVWFFAYGRTGLQSVGHPLSAEAMGSVVPYVSTALANGFGGALSIGAGFGAIAAFCAAGSLAYAWIRGHDVRGPATFAAAILGLYATAAIFRSQQGIEQATAGRYVYVFEVFMILGLALLPTPKAFPDWAHSRRTVRLLAVVVLLITVGHALTALPVAGQFLEKSSAVRTRLAVADALGSWADTDRDALVLPEPWIGLTVGSYRELVSDAGSPSRRALETIPSLPIAQRLIADEAIFTLLRPAFHWGPHDGSAGRGALRVVDVVRGVWSPAGACGSFKPTGGTPWISFHLGSGDRISLTSSTAATLGVYPVVFGTYQPATLLNVDIAAGIPMALAMPRLPGGLEWLVRLDVPPNADDLTICGIA